MECTCIKGNYNFKFDYLDCKNLIYQDMSDWMAETNYSIPETYQVEITVPGFTKPVSLNLKTKCLNKITSLELQGTSDMYLPEGIYCFRVTNCGTTYTRSAANICRLECKWQHMVEQMKDTDDLVKVNQIRFYLDQVLFNALSDKTSKATFFFNLAERELSCIKCNC
jgi:hypothetical protein